MFQIKKCLFALLFTTLLVGSSAVAEEAVAPERTLDEGEIALFSIRWGVPNDRWRNNHTHPWQGRRGAYYHQHGNYPPHWHGVRYSGRYVRHPGWYREDDDDFRFGPRGVVIRGFRGGDDDDDDHHRGHGGGHGHGGKKHGGKKHGDDD